MNQEYFERLSDIAKKAQEPFQEFAELNVKTLQSISYLNPDELTKIKKPEELLEKQVELAVANGRKALEYFHKSFHIFEKAMLSFVQESKASIKETAKKAS